VKKFNGSAKQRRKAKSQVYHLQEGRCAECRRSLVIEQMRITRIDNSTKSCARANLRVVCELCLEFIDRERHEAAMARRAAREQEAVPPA
jgi:hypothetical protein